MKPLIGIVARVEYPDEVSKLVVNDGYRRAIIDAGGTPFLILPPQSIDYASTKRSDMPRLSMEEETMLISQLKMCNGILLPGGFKMTNYDFFILDYAIKNDVPILGICLGMQIMANYGREPRNEENSAGVINHDAKAGLVHYVTIDKSSKMFSIIKEEKFMVNSFHRMHVLPSEKYKDVCFSEDNLIEGVEYPDNRFNLGVQWHPERMSDSVSSKRLFSSFIEASINYKNSLKDNVLD